MNWKVAEAKERFSELVRAAEEEPQWIYNRDRLVAAIVDPKLAEECVSRREDRKPQTFAEAFAELRNLLAEKPYELELPERQDRPNPFVDEPVLPLRHERSR